MRVIAGTYRSRRLKGPGKLRLRPTSDRLRETLFNILGPSIEDSLFVDLFAGTGAIGIEAVSRGARLAILVEAHPATARLAKENLEDLGIRGSAEVIQVEVLHGLDKLAARHLMAHFIFMDPPYENADAYRKVLEYLDAAHLIA